MSRLIKPWVRWGRWVLAALVVAAIFGGLMRTAAGAISIGGAYGTHSSSASSLSWSATLLSGSNRVLTVRVVNTNTAVTVTSVTWGGTALTLLGTATSGSGASHVRATIYYLVAPAGTTNTVIVNLSGTTRVVAGTLDFTGVSQYTPFGPLATASGTSNAPSLTVSASSGDLVSDLLSSTGSAVSGFAAGTGQAEVHDYTGTTSSDSFGAASTKSGSASTTMSYSHTSSSNWALVGMAVKPAVANLSGTVFEDVNYGGGAGRPQATATGAGGSARPSARVELYTVSGSTATYAAATTTDASGNYSFSGLGAGNHAVRVVGSSVTSARTGYTAALLPVLTYRTDASSGTASGVTDHVGGVAPVDTAAGNGAAGSVFDTGTGVFSIGPTGTAQAFTLATVSASSITGLDFGFNFNTVVNVNNAGQGSLRQAITNANTLGGDASLAQSGRTAAIENIVFMISNGTAAAGLRSANNYFSTSAGSYNVATITPASVFPSVTSPLVIDAQTQPGWTLEPRIEINGNSLTSNLFTLSAGSSTLRGFVINRLATNANSALRIDTVGGNTVQGNWFGPDASGATATTSSRVQYQIELYSGSNQIGGTSASARNVISNTPSNGIVVWSGSANVIQGNYIGTNAAGTAALPHGDSGIVLPGASTATGTIIGGVNAGEGNVISGSNGVSATTGGIAIQGTSATGTLIRGNKIGLNAAGSGTIASGGYGVYTLSANTTVGGTTAGAGNTISGYSKDGVAVVGSSATGVTIFGNSIYGNSGLGIDLADNGATANDGAKTGGQPNLLMDSPVFTTANLSGTTLTVAGYVGSAANQSTFASARVEVFVSDNSSSNGQGQTYLGYVTTDASGNFSGTITGVSGITGGTTKVTGTATDASNNTSEFGSNFTTTAISISGKVFEDVNYGGGAGRSLAGSSGTGVSGATVELYNNSGSYLSSTSTASDGSYTFNGLSASTTYYVRVASQTVMSTRTGSVGTLRGVMTYRTSTTAGTLSAVTDYVGGTNPALADPASAGGGAAFSTSTFVFSSGLSGTAHAVAPVGLAAASLGGVDFGFNFSTVVNTNDSGQGSLRQFLTNANALGGKAALAQSGTRRDLSNASTALPAATETSIFMISGGAAVAGLRAGLASQLSSGVAPISLSTLLPQITAASISLDGSTQTANVGDTNAGTLGSGGTVGVDALSLLQIQKPEVEITAPSLTNGIDIGANTVTVRALGLRSTGASAFSSGAVSVASGVSGSIIEGNVIGTRATALTDPGAGQYMSIGVYSNGAGSTLVRNNLIAYFTTTGVQLAGALTSSWTIEYNEIRDGGLDFDNCDGIALTSAVSTTIRGNRITGISTQAVIFGTSAASNALLINNTFSGNGVGPLGAASIQSGTLVARSGAVGVQIEANIITANYGAGVAVNNGASGLALTRNSIYGNGTITSRNGSAATGVIDIDLNSASDNINLGTAPFVTANDNGDGDSGGNGLQNFPVIGSVVVNGAQLLVSGTLNSSANGYFRIEFFSMSAAHPSGYGGGQTYLGYANVATNASGNANINATLSATVAVGTRITATATRTDASYASLIETSEYAANVQAALAISGKVFEDVNYGGGAGRNLASAGGVGLGGVTVELYSASSGYVGSTTTASDGSYSFSGFTGGHFVRVLQSSVVSSRAGSLSSLVGVQTYRYESSAVGSGAVSNEVGGARPDTADSVAAVAASWTNCASEGGSCAFTGTRLVRFGVDVRWTVRVASGGIGCTTTNFGDPAVGTGKTCEILTPHLHSASSVYLSSSSASGVDFGFNFDTVSNINNSGQGSLRQAITNANTLGGDASLAQSGRTAAIENLIFMISNGSSAAGLRSGNNYFTSGVASIAPASALPNVSSPLIVDAQTQTGWSANPIVEINGASAGNVDGLTLGGSGGSSVRGLVINRFTRTGIFISTAGNTVQGCWIGIDATGASASGNLIAGVYVDGATNTIGGTSSTTRNVVSGNGSGAGNGNGGILINTGTANTVLGNYVGLNAAGTAALANLPYGIDISSSSNIIGGTAAGAGNVSSGHQFDGLILRSGGNGNTVQGNFFGTNAANTAVLANSRAGINVSSSNNAIGGTAAGAGNVLRGNTQFGLYVFGAESGNAILGNSIYGNGGIGIDLGGGGVTANDGAKTAGQPNLYMDSPVFTSAALSGSTLTVAGYVGSAAGQSLFASARVEVFLSDNDSSGYGEGQSYIGTLTTDASGNFSGSISVPGGVVLTAGTSRLTGTATDTSNNTSEFGANFAFGLTISGTVFEDGNYGGGAGRSKAAAAGTGLSGARVELYDGNFTFVSAATSDGTGAYTFSGMGNGYYHVRVVNSTVASARSGSTAGLLAVQTWRADAGVGAAAAVTDEVGGLHPADVDAAAGGSGTVLWTFCATQGSTCSFTGTKIVRYGANGRWATRVLTGGTTCNNTVFGDPYSGYVAKWCYVFNATNQSISAVTVSGSSVTAVDFGFNFSTIVNTNDNGQGSLRQFIINANALGGKSALVQSGNRRTLVDALQALPSGRESSIFMITSGSAVAGLRAGLPSQLTAGVALIAPATVLPTVSAALVSIDGSTQSANVGNTNAGSTGTGGTVGVGADGRLASGDETTLAQVPKPEVQISGQSTFGAVLQVNAANTVVRGLALLGSGNGSVFTEGDVLVSSSASGAVVEMNLIGTTAATFTDPGSALRSRTNGILVAATGVTVNNNLIGWTRVMGVYATGTATGLVVSGNEIRETDQASSGSAGDGIGLSSAGATVQGNLIVNAGSNGIDVVGNTPNITDNTITGAGAVGGGERSGIWLRGQSGTVTRNLISANYGSAVRVSGSLNLISLNSMNANGTVLSRTGAAATAAIGIDLNNDGVTANDGAKTSGQPNLLMDSPVITAASVSGSTLTLAGYVGSAAGQSTFASSRIEVFVSDIDPSGFGEGQTYLGFLSADASGNFSGTITVPAGVTLTSGTTRLTTTATDSTNNTSEFGANFTLGFVVSGTVFEDVNYGGGAGRSLVASSGASVVGATVELYNSAGVYVSSTTTASDGSYRFPGLASSSTYYVRVAGGTVLSTRSGSSASLRAVMTYRTNASSGTAVEVTDTVGGTNPALVDPAAASSGATFNTTSLVYSAGPSGTAQSVTTVTVGSASIGSVDFGFNFNTVVNANDAGAGSLRQVITNANALGGDGGLSQSGRTAGLEHVIFMISNGSAAAGLRSSNNYFNTSAGAYNVATITLTSALPAWTAPLVVDGQTQPGWTLEPRIELNGNGLQISGFVISGGGSTLRGFVLNRFSNNAGSTNNQVLIDTAGGNVVQGNWFGPEAGGSTANTSQRLCQQFVVYTGSNLIGGTGASARNVISNASCNGLVVWAGNANTIQGNYIGTNAAGSAALANADRGVLLLGSASNTKIGGSNPGEGNLVSGNGGSSAAMGALQVGSGVTGTLIQGNVIGLNAAGSATLANSGSGVVIDGSSTTVGGITTSAGNVISGNAKGVVVTAGSGNAVLGNRIYANTGIGIDLANDGVTVNDGAKSTGQPNLLMDSPVFTSARATGSQLVVAGYVGSAAGQSAFAGARVEIFIGDNDSTGYGEGKTYLGVLTADASGNFSGTLTMPVASIPMGSKLTATATDVSNNTSEFGAQFASLVDLVVNSNLDEADSTVGDGSCLTASGVCTLRAAIAETNAWPALSPIPTIAFAIPGCTAYGAAGCSIAPATALPSITRAVIIDATTQTGWNSTTTAPMIEINGAGVAAGISGLVISTSTATVRGFVINRFSGNGITLGGSGNTVVGNFIGTNAAGTAAAGNGASGVSITSGSNNVVGGSTAGSPNLISGNAIGVSIASGSGHNLQRNGIYGNTTQGIDLGNDGVSANDGAYSGGQPNQGIDTPVITGAGIDAAGTTMTVYGAIGTGTGQAVFAGSRVEFFKAVADATGRGQGQTYLGFLIADAAGHFSGNVSFASGALVVGDAVTATATDAAGNTSEFGPNWTSTTVAGLTPAGFNAFEPSTAAGATSGVITTHLAGAATTLDVIALNSAGTGLHPGFTGSVALTWIDARDDSGAASGTCRTSWASVASAGNAVFSNSSRVTVSLTPPAASTRVMRLKMTYTSASGTVTACSNDAFAAIPSTLTLAATDADAATAGSTRALNTTAASGGVVHRAGRPFTVTSQARDATGALMTAYDGSPTLAITGCVLPAGCTAGTLTAAAISASGGVYTHNNVNYAEVGAISLQLTDTGYADVDVPDTAAGTRRFASAVVNVGRFVPDSLTATVSSSGQFATANGACMASGQGATFIGQGFTWLSAPRVTVTARNAAGATTAYWSGALMKLAPGSGNVPALAVASAGSATLSSSFGAIAVADLGGGQARLDANSTDRFVLELPAGTAQPSVTPSWAWSLAVTDASEAGVGGNPTLATSASQASVGFNLGAVFHSARLSLSPAHGDARAGVRALVQMQRYTAAGWVTLTEDRGCVTVQPQHLGVESPQGIFTSAGVCAAPLGAAVTTAGGRAWLNLPATPGAAPGRLTLRLAGEAASGNSCTAGGATQALVPMGLPWLLGGAASTGSAALATWGAANRDAVLRREIW